MVNKETGVSILLFVALIVLLQFSTERSSFRSFFQIHQTMTTRKKSRLAFAPQIPIVYVGLNYQMGGGASSKILPFVCEKNDRIVILTNIQQSTPAEKLGPCIEEARIPDESYRKSVSEMPWWPNRGQFHSSQKVFFDRWYVMRDWMRATKTNWVFTTDSDALVTQNMTAFIHEHAAGFHRHEGWLCREPPRCSFGLALLSLDLLEDLTAFWNELFREEPVMYWTNEEPQANDMIAMGHYIHMSEGEGKHLCWANDYKVSDRAPGSCEGGYGYRSVLARLRANNVSVKCTVGSLMINETGQSDIAPGAGLADKNYRHDPTSFYAMRGGQKQLRFVDGEPYFALKNDTWAKHWGYIFEDEMEGCVDHHLTRIRGNESCSCTNFCCNDCSPDQDNDRKTGR